MRTPLQTLAITAAFALLMVIVVLASIYPYRPNSVQAWVVFCITSLPVAFALEYTGTRVLNLGFIARFGRFGRITYAVVAMTLILLVVGAFFKVLEPYFGKWGS
ncbi:MAG: hypothetical protein NUV55_13685 [Sulfuricaulis sp.]|uniref:hypothetical protein n=1 Tax=Sulfuricaulis sp. TaxID=2003553 RepID=UPI0025E2BD93|nr:hypothetical protein [Sulfuricaulis sp.]MCR4348233.1 hypothetical protein [Sulfuricaulis sp.]